mmetsp:Transcript_12439/g.39831  ORF Transcript_12439/g.39831 Transcript_12439/m.39831 type:complete len:154 (+) Transcript_12439:2515-2976(+)
MYVMDEAARGQTQIHRLSAIIRRAQTIFKRGSSSALDVRSPRPGVGCGVSDCSRSGTQQALEATQSRHGVALAQAVFPLDCSTRYMWREPWSIPIGSRMGYARLLAEARSSCSGGSGSGSGSASGSISGGSPGCSSCIRSCSCSSAAAVALSF